MTGVESATTTAAARTRRIGMVNSEMFENRIVEF